MISIITVVNNKDVFERGLQGSLNLQENIEFELIVKNNQAGQYSSLAEAYNEAVAEAGGEWLVFCHPDICFQSNCELNRIIGVCETLSCKNNGMGMFGAAGAVSGKKYCRISTIVHGPDKRGGFANDFGEDGYRSVQTVDACCFILNAAIAKEFPFWSALKGFHMCVEELCLRLNESGISVVVIPMMLWHYSDGKSLDSTYYRETIRVVERHAHIKYFNTTSFQWKVNGFLKFRLRFYQIRNIIHHRLVDNSVKHRKKDEKSVQMSGKSIKINYVYNMLYQVFVLFTPLITAPYISRVLGADGIGTYSYVASIASYFTMAAALGTSIYGQRQISFYQDNEEQRSCSFWNVVVLRFFCTALSSAGYLLYVKIFHQGEMIYAVLTLNILQVALDVSWLFQGMEDFKRLTGRNIAIRILQALYIFLFVKSRSDLVSYAFGLAVFPVLGALSLWPYLKRFVYRPDWRKLAPHLELKNAIALFIPTVAVSIYTVLDKTMIGLFSQESCENGYYEQAMKLSKMVLVVITSLGTVLVPRIGFYHKQKQHEIVRQYMYRSYRFVWMLGIPMCIGMILVAPKIVPWFYGEGFEKAATLLQIMSLLILFIGMSNVTGIQYLLPTEREKMFTRSVSIGAAVNFILNLILIPKFYSLGAAIASVAAEAVITVIQIVWVRKELSPREIICSGRKYAVAGVVMALSLSVESKYMSSNILHSLILVVSGIFIYVLTLFLMRDDFFMKQAATVLQKVWRVTGRKKSREKE